MTVVRQRWSRLGLALATVAALLIAPPAARAQPNEPHEDDGDSPLLVDVLNITGRNFVKAKNAAEASKKRQLQLGLQVRAAQDRLDALAPQIGTLAAESYRSGRVGAAAVLLGSGSPDSFLERAVKLNEMNILNDRKLNELNTALAELSKAKGDLDAEAKQEAKQLQIMAKQKRDAEKALALVGGKSLTGGLVSQTSPIARSAPRNANGEFSSEGCNKDDPTTGGCVTPRTLHAYKEVRRVGFNRFVGCHRSGGPFEHPKGRACDWSLRESGFRAASTRDEKLYGNNLAAFLVRNAGRLGVLYVIWNAQIWLPATGWRSYSGASDHRDHVHMSMI